MADSKLTALSAISVPDLDDLLYYVDDPSGTPVSNKGTLRRILAMAGRSLCEGRPGLVTAQPLYGPADPQAPSSVNTSTDVLTFPNAHGWVTGTVLRAMSTLGGVTTNNKYFFNAASTTTGTLHTTTANAIALTSKVDLTAVTGYLRPMGVASNTLYFSPLVGNRVSLYDGTRWQVYQFSEVSLALSGLTAAKNYDVFLYDNSGTLTLELSAAWTTSTARADALTTQDGVAVKSGALTRRWIGTIRSTETAATEDAADRRFLCSGFNQVAKPMLTTPGYHDNNATTAYGVTASVWTPVAPVATSDSRIEYLTDGVQPVRLQIQAFATSTQVTGLSIDSTTHTMSACEGDANSMVAGNWRQLLVAGYHFSHLMTSFTTTYRADRIKSGADYDVPYTFIGGEVYG